MTANIAYISVALTLLIKDILQVLTCKTEKVCSLWLTTSLYTVDR